MTLRVNEIFNSIQGEGLLIGTPCTFVRLQGCDVGCPWCDTKYTWSMDGGEEMQEMDILRKVRFPLMIITGGEPLLQDIDPFLKMSEYIRPEGAIRITSALETCGAYPLGALQPDWVVVSPKELKDFFIHPRTAEFTDELKFVVDDNLTIDEVMFSIGQVMATRKPDPFRRPRERRASYWSIFHGELRVTLMLEGKGENEEHLRKAQLWLTKNKSWRLIPRAHVLYKMR